MLEISYVAQSQVLVLLHTSVFSFRSRYGGAKVFRRKLVLLKFDDIKSSDKKDEAYQQSNRTEISFVHRDDSKWLQI